MQTGPEPTFTPMRIVVMVFFMMLASWLTAARYVREREQVKVRTRAIYLTQLEVVAVLHGGCITFEGTNVDETEFYLCSTP